MSPRHRALSVLQRNFSILKQLTCMEGCIWLYSSFFGEVQEHSVMITVHMQHQCNIWCQGEAPLFICDSLTLPVYHDRKSFVSYCITNFQFGVLVSLEPQQMEKDHKKINIFIASYMNFMKSQELSLIYYMCTFCVCVFLLFSSAALLQVCCKDHEHSPSRPLDSGRSQHYSFAFSSLERQQILLIGCVFIISL